MFLSRGSFGTFCTLGVAILLFTFTVGMSFPARAAPPEKITIAVLTGITGFTAVWGEHARTMAKLIEGEVNAAGGIKSLGGAQVEFKMYDTESDPKVAGTQAQKIANTDAVAIMGCIHSASDAVASEQTERAGMPFVNFADIFDGLTQRGFKFYWRIGRSATGCTVAGVDFLKWAAKKTGVGPKDNKVVVMNNDAASGINSGDVMVRELTKLGYKVVDRVNYSPTTTSDFTPWLTKYKAMGIDFVSTCSYSSDAIQITRGMKQIDYNPIAVYGVIGGQYDIEYWKQLGPIADYTVCTAYFANDLKVPGLDKLNAKYRKMYGYDIPNNSATFACGATVLLNAIERAGKTDRQAIADAMRKTDIDRVAYEEGKWWCIIPDGCKFDETGQNIRQEAITFQWRSGKQVSVYPEKFAAQKLVWPKPTWKAMGL